MINLQHILLGWFFHHFLLEACSIVTLSRVVLLLLPDFIRTVVTVTVKSNACALLQALMAGSSFCGFADALRAAAPALTPADFPHLEAFACLAKEFPVLKPKDAEEQEPQPPQRRAQLEQPQRKAESELPRPDLQDDQAEESAEPSQEDLPEHAVNDLAVAPATVTDAPSEANAEAKSESSKPGPKADAQTEVSSSAAASTSQAAAQADAKPGDARSDSRADAKEAARADGKAGPKGSRAASRRPSSDGGPYGKSAKAAPKGLPNVSNVKVSVTFST